MTYADNDGYDDWMSEGLDDDLDGASEVKSAQGWDEEAPDTKGNLVPVRYEVENPADWYKGCLGIPYAGTWPKGAPGPTVYYQILPRVPEHDTFFPQAWA